MLLDLLAAITHPLAQERLRIDQAKGHSYFASLDWSTLQEAELPSPLLETATRLVTSKVALPWEELVAMPWEASEAELSSEIGSDPFAAFGAEHGPA